MAYRDGGYRGTPAWVGILFVLVLLGYCARLAVNAPATPTTPARAEALLLGDPAAGALFATIKRSFPDDFTQARRILMQQASAGASEAEMNDALLDFLIAAGRRNMVLAAQAPHAEFAAYRRGEIAVVDALARGDLSGCAEYVTKGAIRGTGGAEVERATIECRRLSWEAAAAGRDTPAGRSISPPAPAELSEIGARMRAAGLTKAEVRAFFDEASLARAKPELQCRWGKAYLTAIDMLPGDRGNAIYAFLMSQGPPAA